MTKARSKRAHSKKSNGSSDGRSDKEKSSKNGKTPRFTGYLLFCKEQRVHLPKRQNGASVKSQMANLGAQWKALSETEKAEYKRRAVELSHQSCPVSNRSKSVKRQQQQQQATHEEVPVVEKGYSQKRHVEHEEMPATKSGSKKRTEPATASKVHSKSASKKRTHHDAHPDHHNTHADSVTTHEETEE